MASAFSANENSSQPVFFYQPPMTSLATSEFPSREEFAGDFDFQMDVSEHSPELKNKSWQYSSTLKKAFVTEGRTLPIRFKIATSNTTNLYIRAVCVFLDPESINKPVLRCPNHMQAANDPLNAGYDHLDHVVSINNRMSVYELDKTSGRRSVSVQLLGPQPGCDWETIMFMMMCRSSCSSGINRRPIAIIFTLEQHYKVLGRRVLLIRVCASPHRDRLIEENKILKKEVPAETTFSGDVGPFDKTYYVPVVSAGDYIALAKIARDFVENEYPEGPLKTSELLKFDQIIMSASSYRYAGGTF